MTFNAAYEICFLGTLMRPEYMKKAGTDTNTTGYQHYLDLRANPNFELSELEPEMNEQLDVGVGTMVSVFTKIKDPAATQLSAAVEAS